MLRGRSFPPFIARVIGCMALLGQPPRTEAREICFSIAPYIARTQPGYANSRTVAPGQVLLHRLPAVASSIPIACGAR
jgi:hypothetical protein